jgi:cellulose synthase/poly-beta-1,6-N-acetylglucosamine synthase-like glycosyltransferase
MMIESLSQFAEQVALKGDQFFQLYGAFGRPFLNFLNVIFSHLFDISLVLLTLLSLVYLLSTIYIMFRKKESYIEAPLAGQDVPFITVQIPSRNEIVALKCAEKCLEFDYPKDRYEILIGDDSDNAHVSKVFADFAASHAGVNVLKREKNEGYKPGNLNNLLKYSKGEYIVVFDSDFLPQKDFLRRIIAPMVSDSSIGAVQARWKFSNSDQNYVSIVGATIVAIVHRVALPFFNKRRHLSILCGSAEAVRKDVLLKLGGWKSGSLTEDIEYSLRLLKSGYKIQYLAQLECDSEVPFKPKDLYRQQMRWAYGVISAVKEHFRDLFFKKNPLNLEDKMLVVYVFSGYVFTLTIFAVFAFGILKIITHAPEPIHFGKFFFETAANIIWTSGLLLTGVFSMKWAGSKRSVRSLVAGAVTYGLVTTYYVNKGILKVFAGKPMPWFLLSKQGKVN